MTRLISPILEQPQECQCHHKEESPPIGVFSWMVRGALILTLAAGALTVLSFSLIPAVFVGLLFFLPALVPVLLLGLGILFTLDMEKARAIPLTDPGHIEDTGDCTCGGKLDFSREHLLRHGTLRG